VRNDSGQSFGEILLAYADLSIHPKSWEGVDPSVQIYFWAYADLSICSSIFGICNFRNIPRTQALGRTSAGRGGAFCADSVFGMGRFKHVPPRLASRLMLLADSVLIHKFKHIPL